MAQIVLGVLISIWITFGHAKDCIDQYPYSIWKIDAEKLYSDSNHFTIAQDKDGQIYTIEKPHPDRLLIHNSISQKIEQITLPGVKEPIAFLLNDSTITVIENDRRVVFDISQSPAKEISSEKTRNKFNDWRQDRFLPEKNQFRYHKKVTTCALPMSSDFIADSCCQDSTTVLGTEE